MVRSGLGRLRSWALAILGVLLLAGIGLGMDRWSLWIHPQMRTWRDSLSSLFFPILAWQFAILALIIVVVCLKKAYKTVGIGFILLGAAMTVLALSVGRSSIFGDGWVERMFPAVGEWYWLNSSVLHVMTLSLLRELLWIGIAILSLGSVLHCDHTSNRKYNGIWLLVISVGLMAIGHLIIQRYLAIPRVGGGSDWGSPSWLSIHRTVVRQGVVSILTLGGWSLTWLAVRRTRWFALPWLLVGTGLCTLYLLLGIVGTDSGLIGRWNTELISTYGLTSYPALAARIFAIGVLGMLMGRHRKSRAEALVQQPYS
jgi:hypothetical protein